MAAGDSKVIGVGRYEDSERKKDVENIVNQSNKKKRREDSTLGGNQWKYQFQWGGRRCRSELSDWQDSIR